MFTWIRRLFLALSFLALMLTNLLTLTSMAFNTALSGVIGTTLGVKTVSSLLQSRLAAQERTIVRQRTETLAKKRATRRFGKRLASRTRRVASKSIAAIPAEAIPYIGIGVLLADTSYELYAACESLRDLDELYAAIGIGDATPEDTLHSVCNPKLPDANEVWQGVVAGADSWWGKVVGAM